MPGPYVCPCCGHLTLPKEPPGSWEICPVCFWEDVPIDAGWIDNQVALRQAQRTFIRIGASDEDWLDYVRSPTPSEARLPNWQFLDDHAKQSSAALMHDIRAAFATVRRENGVTLHQAVVMDSYGTDEEQAQARMLDPDNYWWDVPDERIANLPPALNFLDSVGFRYYIPAFMIWVLKWHRNGQRRWSSSWVPDATIDALYNRSRDAYRLPDLELINTVQSRVICRFLRYCLMFGEGAMDSRLIQEALDNYWGQFCDVP